MDNSNSIELLDIVLKTIANRSTNPNSKMTPESLADFFATDFMNISKILSNLDT